MVRCNIVKRTYTGKPDECALVRCAMPECADREEWVYTESSPCCPACKEKEPMCPDDAPVVTCLVDPCSQASCPNYPTACCRANYCGSCSAEFYENGDVVTKYCDGKDISYLI